MKCYICGGRFDHAGWSSPAEPCDCGECLLKSDALEMDPDDLAAKVKAWQTPPVEEQAE